MVTFYVNYYTAIQYTKFLWCWISEYVCWFYAQLPCCLNCFCLVSLNTIMFNLYILYLYLYNLTSELMWYNFTAMCQIEDVCSHCYFTSSCLNMILISFILLNTLYPSLPYVVNSSLPLMRPLTKGHTSSCQI